MRYAATSLHVSHGPNMILAAADGETCQGNAPVRSSWHLLRSCSQSSRGIPRCPTWRWSRGSPRVVPWSYRYPCLYGENSLHASALSTPEWMSKKMRCRKTRHSPRTSDDDPSAFCVGNDAHVQARCGSHNTRVGERDEPDFFEGIVGVRDCGGGASVSSGQQQGVSLLGRLGGGKAYGVLGQRRPGRCRGARRRRASTSQCRSMTMTRFQLGQLAPPELVEDTEAQLTWYACFSACPCACASCSGDRNGT